MYAYARRYKNSGLSLIEVAVVTVVTSIVLLGLINAFEGSFSIFSAVTKGVNDQNHQLVMRTGVRREFFLARNSSSASTGSMSIDSTPTVNVEYSVACIPVSSLQGIVSQSEMTTANAKISAVCTGVTCSGLPTIRRKLTEGGVVKELSDYPNLNSLSESSQVIAAGVCSREAVVDSLDSMTLQFIYIRRSRFGLREQKETLTLSGNGVHVLSSVEGR